MKSKLIIGLSLSFCVYDILRNKVNIEDISAIVTSTAFNNVDEVMSMYYESLWYKYAPYEHVRAILIKIWPIVFQPRLVNPESRGHYISKGCWVNIMTGEIF